MRGAETIAVGQARQWQQRDGGARPSAIASTALLAGGRRAQGGDEGPALRAARPSAQPARARCQPPLPQYFTALQLAPRRWPASPSALRCPCGRGLLLRRASLVASGPAAPARVALSGPAAPARFTNPGPAAPARFTNPGPAAPARFTNPGPGRAGAFYRSGPGRAGAVYTPDRPAAPALADHELAGGPLAGRRRARLRSAGPGPPGGLGGPPGVPGRRPVILCQVRGMAFPRAHGFSLSGPSPATCSAGSYTAAERRRRVK